MRREDVRKVVSEQFHQSLADEGVQITSIPPEQLQSMVNAVADGVFAVFDMLEDETNEGRDVFVDPVRPRPYTAPASDARDEQVLWRGRPYLTIGTRYELTSERLRIIRGILGKNIEEIELVRVRDTKVKQHMGERVVNVGDITVISADETTPEFVLHNVRNPLEVRELIRKTVQSERRRRGLYYREDIGDAI